MRQNFDNAYIQVYLDQAERGLCTGHIDGPRLESPLFFADTSGLLLRVDALLDEQDFPRAYQRKRSFAPKEPDGEEFGPHIKKSGEKARAFALYITSRRNASWQGLVDWLDGRPAQGFASELEFLRLLDGELS